jgi:hypothetical protein
MGSHVCKNCKKIYRTKEILDNHLQECAPLPLNKYAYSCKICSKLFTSSSNLKYHIKTQHYQVKPFEPQETIKGVTNNTTSVTNITNNNITNDIKNLTINNNTFSNKISNNINVQPLLFVKHGEERIDHITKEFLLKLLNYTSSQRMFVDLMATLYFSSEVPENNNWTLAYPYNDKAAIVYDYDAQKFKRTSTEAVINEKFANMINKLVPMMDEIKEDYDNLTKEQKLNLLHFYDKECVYDISNQYPDIYALIHKLAYEQRFVPMTSWKEQGLSGNHLSIKF